MAFKEIGTGRIVGVRFEKKGASVLFHPDGESPSYHLSYRVSRDRAMFLIGDRDESRSWVGSRVMVKVSTGHDGGDDYTFHCVPEDVVFESPGDIARLREEWSRMKLELEGRKSVEDKKLKEELDKANKRIEGLLLELEARGQTIANIQAALRR